jgi:hypothetical protein
MDNLFIKFKFWFFYFFIRSSMPDELCRMCGGSLVIYSLCSACRKPIQRICMNCGIITLEQFHSDCFYHIESFQKGKGIEINVVTQSQPSRKTSRRTKPISKDRRLRNAILAFSMAGLCVLGFAATGYLDLFGSHVSEALATKSISKQTKDTASISEGVYENCLAYGSGQSMTVTCPTGYGTAYVAVLDIPYDLSAKFSNAGFSIRGISLNEHNDGSVVMAYQKNLYYTKFFTDM